MVAQGYGLDDKVNKAGDVMSGNLTLEGTPPLTIPAGGAAAKVLTSDASGNATWQAPTSGGATIDTTGTDIQPLGAQAAGSVGLAADSGHVHPTTGVVLTSSLPLAIASGGSGQTTASAAFNAISPLTTQGDVLAAGASGVDQRVAGNTTTTKEFLTSTGTGAAANVPAWGTLAAADLPAATTGAQGAVQLAGDLAGTGASPAVAKLQGVTLGTNPGGTSAFLRADGTWAAPSGGGGSALTEDAVVVHSASPYSISAGHFAPVDTSSGTVTVTLPTAPADQSQVAVKMIAQASGNAVTINCGGSDHFNVASTGSTSATLTLLMQGTLLQYDHTNSVWYVLADDLPLAQLDARYGETSTTASWSTGAQTLSTATADVYNIALSGSVTVGTLTATSAGVQSLTLYITQSGSGAITSWPGSVTWLAGSPPPIQTGTLTIITLETPNGGTNWYGAPVSPVSLPLSVANGGTGGSALTAYGVVVGGTGSTSPLASAGTGTSGQVLTSGGASAVPTWSTNLAGNAAGLSSTLAVGSGGTGQTTLAAVTLDEWGAAAGAVSMGSHKITSLTNGSSASDAAAFGQIPATLDVVPAPLASVSLNSQKITSLLAGSASTDAVNVSQVPSLSSNGAATSTSGSSTTTAETVLGTVTLPASMAAGSTWRLTAWGTVAIGASSGTVTTRSRIGGLTGSLLASAVTATISSGLSGGFRAAAEVTLQTAGSSGTWSGGLTPSLAVTTTNGLAAGTPQTPPTLTSLTTQAFVITIQCSSSTTSFNTLGYCWERIV